MKIYRGLRWYGATVINGIQKDNKIIPVCFFFYARPMEKNTDVGSKTKTRRIYFVSGGEYVILKGKAVRAPHHAFAI